MNPATPTQKVLTRAAAFLLATFLMAGAALAFDQPPPTAPQQRAWLVSHLVTDMQTLGTFQSTDIAQMVSLVNALTDNQVSLLARFYYLTREKTEQDAQLYAVQQTESGDALAQAKAQVADLLTQLQSQIQQTYSQLATISPPCQTLCQIAYASVPGWCAYNQYAIPDWYYGNGCYVGPVCSAGYCGAYAVPVYNTFYNRGSRYNYWNSRTFVHNNITRIAHWHDAISRIHGSQHGPTVAMHHNVAPVLKVNRSPLALAKHNNSHPRTRAVAHSRPKAAAHPKARTLAHAAPRPHPQHVAHVARPRHVAHAHPQHVARAHAQSGHGRHK